MKSKDVRETSSAEIRIKFLNERTRFAPAQWSTWQRQHTILLMVTRPTRPEVGPISGQKFESDATTEAVRAVSMMGEPEQLLDGSVASDAARSDAVHAVSI